MIPTKVYKILLDVLPMVILFSIVMILLRVVSSIYAKEKIDIRKDGKNLLYIIYCFCLFVLVTNTDFESYSNNFIPFKEILRYQFNSKLFIRNVIGNMIIFLPFGYLITDMIQTKVNKCNIFITGIISLITSTSIEVIQMFIGRSFDIDDIILNLAGALVGYIIYKISHFILKLVRKRYDSLLVDLLAFGLLMLVLIIIVIISYKVVV